MAERPFLPGGRPWSVVWTRGKGCPELAALLGEGRERRVGPDLVASCIEARADLLVARRLTAFDLVPVAVPHDLNPDSVGRVVAAVAGGPHSLLAARIAQRLSDTLGVPATLMAASRDPDSDEAAEAALSQAADLVPMPERRVLRAASPGRAVRSLPAGSLLVLGAPGGAWWRRQFFGPGHQLQVAAPSGTVVVRTAPRRCFHEMGEPAAMGTRMPAGEALRLTTDSVIPVADEGCLVGVVRRRVLAAAAPTTTLASLMEAPVSVRLKDPLSAGRARSASLEGSPVPVVDAAGRLCGLLAVSPRRPTR